ncbi:hypothetical protein HMPREF1051_2236 [Neisseria sicca VK64]|uniref:Uncharacterized protein n=1 Tax=Neisseria sicca VK64 TaxID=1095748 RepID=I2NR34_NEISI|nr:hypothetical protein HMPREF1051_2236 [Neisseria sicca VK64]
MNSRHYIAAYLLLTESKFSDDPIQTSNNSFAHTVAIHALSFVFKPLQ